MRAPKPSLHVGMISLTDPDDANRVSGMPHRVASALRAQGVRVTPIVAAPTGRDPRPARIYRRRVHPRLKRIGDNLFPRATADALRRRAAELAAGVRAQLDALCTTEARRRGETPDLLFGVCIATALADLDTDLPIVYFSDAASPIINATYPSFRVRGRALLDTRVAIERAALARVTRAAFAAPVARDSAIDDLGLDPAIASTIPMGANITPADPVSVRAPSAPPSARDCRLLIIAADPERKRVDLAVRAAESLRSSGIHATLSVIGPGTRLARRSEAVDFCRPLLLSDPEHAAEHRRLLHACHLQLLPSVGEAFGIAPTESAHFARPSVVSDAGGLPFVVRHDDSGLVIPVEEPHQAWANAIASLVRDPERYRRYSAAALARARIEFTWSAWATKMVGVMHEAVDGGPAAIGTAPADVPDISDHPRTRSAG
ncbi:MAG: glycosyltransferase family 4 protein [Planctomycetota bacterium]